MTLLYLRKGNRIYYCPKCHADTPHYLRANGETAVCLGLGCGYERPVGQLVRAMPVTSGGPERNI